MQLKGLVRFFTIILILVSLYMLSFTLVVRNHEKKMESKAREYVKNNFQPAAEKYPGNKDSQAVYQEVLDKAYQTRLQRLLDSTKDVTVTYGINGKVSYKKAKEDELNLGLDLQGGLNVTLEVEMSGLLKSLANNTKDPNFLQAIVNGDKRKANSSADFITLFIEEYRKLEPNRPLATLFATASNNRIDVKSSDDKVKEYIRDEASDAFDRTLRVLRTRIDQFGVASPNINPNYDKKIIAVELAGIKDKERARKVLQTTANLQFWEVYTLQDANYRDGWQRAIELFNARFGGASDSTLKKDSANTARKDSTLKDTNGSKQPIAKAIPDTTKPGNELRKIITG
ncbi:MAG TPA: hypothetical protein VN451_04700, partial [Chitinophagaceae bacterium]|nr:hypothetical protein [Chitinophagaceae bacterium]